VANPYGFKASFNPSYPGDRRHPIGWVSPYHFGINEGPTVVMIENWRSQGLWKIMRACAPLVAGLRRAGFAGGWLDAIPAAELAAPSAAMPAPDPFDPPTPPQQTAVSQCPGVQGAKP